MNIQNIDLLIKLIKLYVETVVFFSNKLSISLKIENLTDWRAFKIPIQGSFCNDYLYAFHGSGCFISSPDIEVDFEFDEKCQVGGFDMWRLWSFISDNQENKIFAEFIEFIDKNELEETWNILLKRNIIKKYGDMYYLSDENKK